MDKPKATTPVKFNLPPLESMLQPMIALTFAAGMHKIGCPEATARYIVNLTKQACRNCYTVPDSFERNRTSKR